LKVEASFVVSAAAARDLPREALPEVALVGRSNVGKSSLINALVRQKVARTSSAPGKTRLANVYRVRRGAARAFYLVDLPGYGFARGDRRELMAVAGQYFGRVAHGSGVREEPRGIRAALLLIDARHPGLPQDVEAWQWLRTTIDHGGLVATKIDKLSRSERQRAMKTNEAVFEHPVLAVSADTGEGLDELWKLIDRLTTSE
jgi:GTP-binding protein